MRRTAAPLALVTTALTFSLTGQGVAAGAPNPSCGNSYTTVASESFDHGEVVLQRDGDSWCAYTRRTGDYYGEAGFTRVVLSEPGGHPNDVVNDGRLSYYVGPVYLEGVDCVYAFGVVGNEVHYEDSGSIPLRCTDAA